MSTITSVYNSTSTYSTYQGSQGTTQGSTTQAQALVALGAALQAGSVSGSQAALTSFQQGVADSSQSADIPPFPPNVQADADYADLVNSVHAGNLSDARAALAKLQIDLKQSQHHHSAVPVPTQTIDTSDAASSLETPSTSGNYLNVTV